MSKRLTTEEFIQKAKLVHGEKYNYNEFIYSGCENKSKIFCSKHGLFLQDPYHHLKRKQGCPICKKETLSKNKRFSIETFIEKSNQIHNKYNYSKVIYINAHTKVCIICPEHGEFWQTPCNHINGLKGCPICNFSKGELLIERWLKEQNIKFIPQKRFKNCRNQKPLPFDFYLPEINTCIEYDGKQHFDLNSRYYSDKLIKNDKIKNEYCKQNNIRLLRIKYNQNIKNILDLKIQRG